MIHIFLHHLYFQTSSKRQLKIWVVQLTLNQRDLNWPLNLVPCVTQRSRHYSASVGGTRSTIRRHYLAHPVCAAVPAAHNTTTKLSIAEIVWPLFCFVLFSSFSFITPFKEKYNSIMCFLLLFRNVCVLTYESTDYIVSTIRYWF